LVTIFLTYAAGEQSKVSGTNSPFLTPLFRALALERILVDHQLHVSAIRTGNSTQFDRGFRPTEKGLAKAKLDVPRFVSLNCAGHAVE
jgi:hypothetical protein